MRKLFFLLGVFTLTTPLGYAQVGIGTDTPDPSAALEIYSTNKGITLPNVELSSVKDLNSITKPVNGLLIFNKTHKPDEGLYTGLYYWDETAQNWTSIFSKKSFSSIMDSYAVEEGYVVANEKSTQTLGASYSQLSFSSANVVLNRDNSFSNNMFQVPEDNFYNIHCGMEIGKDIGDSASVQIRISGSKTEYIESSVSRNNIKGDLSPSVVFTGELKKNDQVKCYGKYNVTTPTFIKYFYVTKF
jgi:hypothetical protein